jgi:hypothetical protein
LNENDLGVIQYILQTLEHVGENWVAYRRSRRDDDTNKLTFFSLVNVFLHSDIMLLNMKSGQYWYTDKTIDSTGNPTITGKHDV